tara:strand:+ start:380 stop:988 length:609 start_codon:yes stop_codon:yes gene_type:complete
MQKYLKAIFDICKNYHFYSIPVLLNEALFHLQYNTAVNKFKYLNDDFLSDSIPCSYFFLKKIKKFLIKRNINHLCDLGSGYGKVLYFFGNINNYKIDGIELDREIYLESALLKNNNITVYNENILNFDLGTKNYDLFIINDPLKKYDELLILITKIKKLYTKSYMVFINLDEKKIESVTNNLRIVDSFIISRSRNIFFCYSG